MNYQAKAQGEPSKVSECRAVTAKGVPSMQKGWLYGHEVMREWQITDITLLQWLLDGLPAYSPNSLKKIEKHVFEREGLIAFCEWSTATSFRAYSVEGLRMRLLGLIFTRSDIENAAAGIKPDDDPGKELQWGRNRLLAGRDYVKERWAQIDWTTMKRWANRGNCIIAKLLNRF